MEIRLYFIAQSKLHNPWLERVKFKLNICQFNLENFSFRTMDKEIGTFCCCCWFEGFLIVKQKLEIEAGTLSSRKQILKDWEPSVERRNLLKLKRNLFLICRTVCFRRKKQFMKKLSLRLKSPFSSFPFFSKSPNLISSHVRILTPYCDLAQCLFHEAIPFLHEKQKNLNRM